MKEENILQPFVDNKMCTRTIKIPYKEDNYTIITSRYLSNNNNIYVLKTVNCRIYLAICLFREDGLYGYITYLFRLGSYYTDIIHLIRNSYHTDHIIDIIEELLIKMYPRHIFAYRYSLI